MTSEGEENWLGEVERLTAHKKSGEAIWSKCGQSVIALIWVIEYVNIIIFSLLFLILALLKEIANKKELRISPSGKPYLPYQSWIKCSFFCVFIVSFACLCMEACPHYLVWFLPLVFEFLSARYSVSITVIGRQVLS